ncbi:phosphoribosylamine--glycine ligase [Fulvivirgaceae bacterium BMA12]|uniref:Phosphoribosylamine--glycine ligase n=1 Tax=Agaribacillus aureus TaxID=3051825 RepID=A0ABT8LF54_9BACT|nr:phosphoribosylamine--glycine ligase [Fulvivirgaceae bacterium BMA12]
MNILIIGSGGREHALSWKIKQSQKCEKLFVLPGNAGTASLGQNVNIAVDNFADIGNFALENNVSMIVVGPEVPLVKGITDYFKTAPELSHIKIIGPDKKGAQLEGSKDFAKDFMQKNNIPTAGSRTFTKESLQEGLHHIQSLPLPIVLKADGLAAGKGVIIAQEREEAARVLEEMLVDERFGEAGAKVVIEEFLSGIELSVFVLTDGKHYVILPEAKDYKRIGENDSGPNTGGMGAVSPVPFADANFMTKVEERIIQPTIAGLSDDGVDYCGFIFIGLMNVGGDPYVIEYNVRMGDPETQAVLPRIQNDLVDLLEAAASGKLDDQQIQINPETATTVVMVSGGYPGSYDKGFPISGIDLTKETTVFHAGTKFNEENQVLTSGGRVLAITGMDKTLSECLEKTYRDVDKINWEKANFRKDIGQDILRFNG